MSAPSDSWLSSGLNLRIRLKRGSSHRASLPISRPSPGFGMKCRHSG